MPFTPSHAVVALPFVRTRMIPAAIAIGAMTPDLPLYIRGTPVTYAFTHSLGNIVWTTAIAAGLFLLWRVLFRPALPDLMPRAVRERLPASWRMSPAAAVRDAVGKTRPRAHLPILVLSLALGVATHIVWDSFTHKGRAGVSLLPFLTEMWGPVPGFTWVQHGSSIISLLLIAGWAALWLSRRVPEPAGKRAVPAVLAAAWAVALPLILIAALIVGFFQRGPFTAAFTPQHLAYAVLPQACAVWAVITVAVCLVILIVRARSDAATSPDPGENNR